jgi:hypothetical protein
MPNRGRKRASRQAQLSQKKRRTRSGASSQAFDAGPTQSREAAQTTPSDQHAPVAATAAPAQATPRRQRRPAAANTPIVYRYLGRELRQIGILASLMVVVLVALSFVLG